MAAAVPQNQLQPVALPQPEQAKEPGHLGNREVSVLWLDCLIKHNETGKAVKTALEIVGLIAALTAAAMVSGWAGILVGAAVFFVGCIPLAIYEYYRNHDYHNAAVALQSKEFCEYVVRNGVPTIDTVVEVHKEYMNKKAAAVVNGALEGLKQPV